MTYISGRREYIRAKRITTYKFHAIPLFHVEFLMMWMRGRGRGEGERTPQGEYIGVV